MSILCLRYMALTELYHESFLVLSLDAEASLLHADWRGYQSIDSVKQGSELILAMLVQHKVHRILNDNTKVLGIWRVAAEWLAKDWFPRLQQAGMRRYAWINSPAKLSQVSTEATLALMDADSYNLKVFHGTQEALAWLMSAPEPKAKKPATRTLVIEDNADFSRLFGDMLGIMGCSVELTASGEAGLAAARRHVPDIIFCDIGLPGKMDGYEFARQLRADPRLAHIALIAVSGLTGEEIRQRAEQAGFDRVFPKPVKFVDVSKTVAAFAKSRR